MKKKRLTTTEITKYVVALLREGDLVDSVADETSLQQVAGVLACLTAICEALDVMEEPVDYI